MHQVNSKAFRATIFDTPNFAFLKQFNDNGAPTGWVHLEILWNARVNQNERLGVRAVLRVSDHVAGPIYDALTSDHPSLRVDDWVVSASTTSDSPTAMHLSTTVTCWNSRLHKYNTESFEFDCVSTHPAPLTTDRPYTLAALAVLRTGVRGMCSLCLQMFGATLELPKHLIEFKDLFYF